MIRSLLLGTLAVSAAAQAQNLQWAVRAGAGGNQYTRSSTVDDAGNLYTAGVAYGPAFDIDHGPGTSLVNSAEDAWFIAKHGTDGDLAWARSFDLNFGGIDAVRMAADGNLIVLGRFTQSVDLDPGAGEYLIGDEFGHGMYGAAYDPEGAFLGAAVWDLSGGSAVYPSSLMVAGNGDLIIGGVFSGTVDFDPGAGVDEYNAPQSGVFVVRLDADAQYLWTGVLSGDQTISINTVFMAIDTADRVWVHGTYSGTFDVDPGTGSMPLSANGSGEDRYIAIIDPAGQLASAGTMGGIYSDGAQGIAPAPDGGMYLVARFQITTDTDPGPGSSELNVSGNSTILQKLDANGGLEWARPFGPVNNYMRVASVHVTPQGTIRVHGDYQGTLDADLGPAELLLPPSPSGAFMGFTAVYDLQGAMLQALAFTTNGTTEVNQVSMDAQGRFYAVGRLDGEADLDPGPAGTTISADDGTQLFFARFDACITQATGTTVESCGPFVWDGDTYENSGSFERTFTSTLTQCDSVVTMVLSITSVPAVITNDGVTLSAEQVPDATYQWLDCNDGMAPVAGQTAQAFTPETTGTFAVQVMRDGCSAISDCEHIEVLSTGIADATTSGARFVVDAAHDRVVVIGSASALVAYRMYDALGGLCAQGAATIALPMVPGMYIIEGRFADGSSLSQRVTR